MDRKTPLGNASARVWKLGTGSAEKDTPGRRVGSKKLSDTTSTTLGLTAGSADCSASARSWSRMRFMPSSL